MNDVASGGSNMIWQLDSAVRFRRLLDEAVLIHQEKAEALVLNDTAVSFIELCDGKRTVDEIIAEIVENFEVSAEQLVQDLTPFIKELSREGIIKPV
jgi:hypothetical protein